MGKAETGVGVLATDETQIFSRKPGRTPRAARSQRRAERRNAWGKAAGGLYPQKDAEKRRFSAESLVELLALRGVSAA